jgi:cysteinyl-tRNA synthetase
MPIYIYNSLTRKKEEFVPLTPSETSMYVCGPTVYDEPHIGHARSAYVFDVIRRYMIYRGYKVRFVRNVTDVDDKIIDKARKEYKGQDLNVSFKKVADKYLAEYHDALHKLEIYPDSGIIEPKASEYIKKMVSFIEGLIHKNVAYASGGDVYFDISKAKNYGKLSHQSLDKMEIGARVAPGENKRNHLDFALWKSAKEDEPSWESPWGRGRPGWHIECSVMSSDILGDEFDIHGGGLDLIFPHHENEIAQSEGAGKKFARYWIHHGLLNINGQKMSKSLGNFVTVNDFMNTYGNPDFLKLFFLSTHYSHPIDYTNEKIEEARKQKTRFNEFFAKVNGWRLREGKSRVAASRTDLAAIDTICSKFHSSMDDDFNAPQALASLFELIDLGFGFVSLDKEEVFNCVKSKLETFFNIFGLKVIPKQEIPEIIEKGIKERDEARRNKDFKKADEIRKELGRIGYVVSDTAGGLTIMFIPADRNEEEGN